MKAIGIVRVSSRNGREGESFLSPDQQQERIEQECERRDLRLVEVMQELDVSGGTPLEERTGLRTAVEMVEAGEAGVIVAGWADRAFRSIKVQGEVVERVERHGGQVLSVDFGPITEGSASQWLTGTLIGTVNDYYRRQAKERNVESQRRAVERGIPPWARCGPGYDRGPDKRLVPNGDAPIVAEAFRRRAEGHSVSRVREYLKSQGISISFSSVDKLFRSRIVLGEVRFGKQVNPEAHEPIVDRELWNTVQRTHLSRGRRAKSDRLLARQGVVRCVSCGRGMVIGTGTKRGRKYYYYRCSESTGDCEARQSIIAHIVEDAVVEHVRALLADREGRASAEGGVRDAEAQLAQAQDTLDAAIRTFDGFDEPSARERLLELRRARDDAQDRLDRMGGTRAAETINATKDWERLSLEEQRALIRAVIERVTVGPGKGVERIEIQDVAT
jgi:DNA invertase Pin-like site-specific DNA recombinase